MQGSRRRRESVENQRGILALYEEGTALFTWISIILPKTYTRVCKCTEASELEYFWKSYFCTEQRNAKYFDALKLKLTTATVLAYREYQK